MWRDATCEARQGLGDEPQGSGLLILLCMIPGAAPGPLPESSCLEGGRHLLGGLGAAVPTGASPTPSPPALSRLGPAPVATASRAA